MFIGCSAQSFKSILKYDCKVTAVLGYDFNQRAKGSFHVTTNGKSPFAVGLPKESFPSKSVMTSLRPCPIVIGLLFTRKGF